MTAEVEVDVNVTVNGGGGEVSVPPKDLPNGNANAEAGLVFVNGCGNGNRDRSDAVSSDPVKTDLNSGSSVDVSVAVAESELDNSKPVVETRESVVESEIDQVVENGGEKIEIFHVEEKQESPVVVDDGTDGEVDRENEVSDSTNGEVLAENQGVSDNRNSEVDTELVVVESADNDQPQDSTVVVGDLLDGDQCTPPQIEPEPVEIAESMPSLVNDDTDLPVEPARENENDTAESMPSLINDATDLPVEPACENENDTPDMTNDAADLPEIAESVPSLVDDTNLPVEPAREIENDTPDMTNDAADLPEIEESMPSLINDATDLLVEPARENENDTPDKTNDAADLPEIAESMPSLINDATDLPVEPAHENENDTPDMTNDAADLPAVESARENENNDTPDMTNDAADLPAVESARENENDTPDMTNDAADLPAVEPARENENDTPDMTNDAADLPVEPACENKNDTPDMTNSSEEVKVDLEESAPCGDGDVELESQVFGGPAADLGTGHTQDIIPETVVSVNLDARQEETPLLSDSCEIANESLPSPVVVSEDVPIETAPSVPAPVSISTEEPEPAPVSITEPEPAPFSITTEEPEPAELVSNINIEARGVAEEVENIEARDVAEEVENGPGAGEEVPEGVAEEVETATIEPKVTEGAAEDGENGLNNGAGSENNSAGSEIGLNNSTGSAVKVSNMEPKVPGGVGNGPLSNDLNNDEKVSTSPSDSSIELKVPEGVAETEVESRKASTWKDSSMETKVSEGVNCKSVVTVVSSSRDVPVQVENGEILFTGEDNDDKKCLQVDNIDGIHRDEAPVSTTESASEDQKTMPSSSEEGTETMPASSEDQNVGTEAVPSASSEHQNEAVASSETVAVAASTPESSVAASESQNVGTEVVKRPFYCLIKVPRFEDDNLKEQIKLFQLKVDEKTRSRDAIRDTIHTRRTNFKENGENLEAAISEEKTAREILKSKRQEIDSLQLVINKLKNVKSVEDIDSRIRQMKHRIEHETLPLKEEKQLIREIEQLKQHREQFSSSIGKQDEIQQAFDQKDQIEERLKVLRKEADSLRENVSKAEAATQAARKKHRDESEKLRELHAQFKAADDTRQEAYKNLQSFRKQAYDKNKYFWNYKDDVKAANDLLLKGDKDALLNLCDNQVERVLEMWNNNDEFRKEYVRCNINSTLRRLKTLDGRSLGPNEEPPVIRSAVINRVARNISASQISTVKEQKPEQVVPVKAEKENKSVAKVVVQKDQAAKSERPAKPAHLENGSATVSGRNEIEEAKEEEPKRTKEEEELARKTEELARKAEELRKKEEAAKLKEQHRLEEKVKAKEALERKKRIAEKAQARAVLRAQKEAEQKEKEREKRARKKDKKKVAAVDDASVTNEEESAPSMETPTETPALADVKDKSTTVTKKTQKISQFTKQTKSKSVVPLPLRNRGKRRMQSWMWVLIAALAVFALFLLGNSGFSFKSGLQWFGF